jgi:Glucose-6-phosphate dehydrogenase subunit
VRRITSAGPGLTAVRLRTSSGAVTLDRADGTLATLGIEGQPDRAVALKRRETSELIAEELRRLDPDDTYASALKYGLDRLNASAQTPPQGAEQPGHGPEQSPEEGPGPEEGPEQSTAAAEEGAGEPVAVETPEEEAVKAPAERAASKTSTRVRSRKASAK